MLETHFATTPTNAPNTMLRSTLTITRDDGRTGEAAAPVILSASRRTDIPAFYAEWFMARLARGYCAWRNPFSGRQSFVAFGNVRFVVFCSKNPKPLLKHLPELQRRGIGVMVHFTLNDYEAEGHEPQLASWEDRIDTFRRLSDALGPDAVLWRNDPLVLTPELTTDRLLEKWTRTAEALAGFTDSSIMSFADIADYRKVRNNLVRHGIDTLEWSEDAMRAFGAKLSAANRALPGGGFTLSTCAETVNLSAYGITHGRCVDHERILRVALRQVPDRCSALLEALGGRFDPADAETPLPARRILLKPKKDPGQRPACGCHAAKDIGQYDTCPHLCRYCYANAKPETVLRNWKTHCAAPAAEGLLGDAP